MTEQTVHHYPGRDLVGDYVRGSLGTVATGAPIVLLSLHWLPGVLLGSCFVVFATFLVRTAYRHQIRVLTDEAGITVTGPLGKRLHWDTLKGLRLKFYATRRDRSDGWMHLTLDGPEGRIRLESMVTDFESIIERAADAARKRELALTEVTRSNLTALGVDDPHVPDEPSTLETDDWDWSEVGRHRTGVSGGDGPREPDGSRQVR